MGQKKYRCQGVWVGSPIAVLCPAVGGGGRCSGDCEMKLWLWRAWGTLAITHDLPKFTSKVIPSKQILKFKAGCWLCTYSQEKASHSGPLFFF